VIVKTQSKYLQLNYSTYMARDMLFNIYIQRNR